LYDDGGTKTNLIVLDRGCFHDHGAFESFCKEAENSINIAQALFAVDLLPVLGPVAQRSFIRDLDHHHRTFRPCQVTKLFLELSGALRRQIVPWGWVIRSVHE
jgi:hypothetical protein